MRYPGLDLLRGIAAFGIVGRHLGLLPTTAAGMTLLHFTDTNVAIFGAVSGFLMAESIAKREGERVEKVERVEGVEKVEGVERVERVEKVERSGHRLISHLNDCVAFAKARCRRLLPAYFFWTVVFIVMTMTFDLLCDGGKINPKFYTLGYWRSAILFGTSSTHLWYVAWLFYWGIALRLVWPIVRRLYVALPLAAYCLYQAAFVQGDFNYYALRLLAFMLIGIMIRNLRHNTLVPLNQVEGGRLKVERRNYSAFWLALGLAAIVAHACFADWETTFLHDAAIVIPLLLLCTTPNIRETRLGTWLGSLSFGIYLVHPLFAVGCAWAVKRSCQAPYSAKLIFTDWLLIGTLSLVAVCVMKAFGNRYQCLKSIC